MRRTLLIPAIALALSLAPSSRADSICERLLCLGKNACASAIDYGKEVIKTRGARLLVKPAHPDSKLFAQLGWKFMPTTLSMALAVSVPSWYIVDTYIEQREELVNRQLDYLVENDLRFEQLQIAKEAGTLDSETVRRAAIELKSVWETYATRLMAGPIPNSTLMNELPKAERGEFPFQRLHTLVSSGVGNRQLTTEEKISLISLTHEYNLRLVLINIFAQKDRSRWQKAKTSSLHLFALTEEIEKDRFLSQAAQIGSERPDLFPQTYHIMQVDALNQFALKVASRVGIKHYKDNSTEEITLRDVRQEQVEEAGIPLPLN